MKKKILSVILCITMILSLFSIVPFLVSAEEVDVAEIGTSKTADEAINWVKSKVGYPVGYNDGSGQYQCVELIQEYYRQLGVNAVSGNGCDYAWNSLPSGWTRTAGGQPQKGDILVYTDGGYGHVAIYESDYSFYQQNYNYHPYVEHSTFKYNNYSMMHVSYWGCIHPNFSNSHTCNNDKFLYYWAAHPHYNTYGCSVCGKNDTADFYSARCIDNCPDCKVDVGNNFCANIIFTKCNSAVTAEDDNAEIQSFTNSDKQKWIFTKESSTENVYSIKNVASGKYMDVVNFGTANRTNIGVWYDNDTDAQRFYISRNGSSYYISPKCCTTSSLDVCDGATADGTNIQLYTTQNLIMSQQFQIVNTPAFTPEILGKEFTAKITHKSSKNAVAAVETDVYDTSYGINVQTEEEKDSDRQLWKFVLQDDNSYEITNLSFEKCLDVRGGTTENKLTIQLFNDNDGNAQRWFIKKTDSGYILVPKCATLNALTIQDNNSAINTNVISYTENDGASQLLAINIIPECIFGDTDKDGTISIVDATLIQKYLAKLVNESEIDLDAADTDKDGSVSITDATQIQKYLAGLIKEL